MTFWSFSALEYLENPPQKLVLSTIIPQNREDPGYFLLKKLIIHYPSLRF